MEARNGRNESRGRVAAGEPASAAPIPRTTAGGGDATTLSRRDKTLALAGTLAALLMAGLDQTIVSTAGPEIQRDLAIPASIYPWITTAYLVSSTVMLPIYGKLSDTFGRKPVLLVGVGLFLVGSLLCGLAPTTAFLIGARALQGLGAASLFTTTLAVIADLFPPGERGKYMGLIGAVMGISSVIGPVAGGVITDLFGWHWVFFVNLPVGLVASWLIVTRMPALGGNGGAAARIDVAGAFWLLACVVPLLLALSLGRPASGEGYGFAWSSAPILGMFGAAAAALVAFLLTERRARDPILDLSIFGGNRTIAVATATMFVFGSTFLVTVVFLPLYLVNVLGISVSSAGLTLTPLTLAMVATSVLAGQLASRFGNVRGILVTSMVLTAAAFAVMAFTLTPTSTPLGVTLRMVLIGLGMGPTLPLFPLLVQNAARAGDVGVVTSGAIFSRAMGQVVGLTLFGALFAASLAGTLAPRAEAALATLSPGARRSIADAAPALQRAGEGFEVGFDAEGVRQRLTAVARSASPDPTATGTSAPGLSDVDLRLALAAVDEIESAYDEALTAATTMLYRVGLGIILLSLALGSWIPPDRRPAGVDGRRGAASNPANADRTDPSTPGGAAADIREIGAA